MDKANILVVEDETIVALDIESRLKKLGYRVCATVEDGAEAVNKAAELQPDLVLMDIHLRGDMNGIEAAREIYNNFLIPSIYLTANSDQNTFEKAKTTEPLAYLNKPFRERELSNTIELTLSRYKAEKKVKENEQWLSAVLNSIGDAVIISERHNQIKFMNPVAETLTQWQQPDALERNIAEVFNIINEVTRTPIESPLKQAIEENTVVKILEGTILIAKNGAEIPIEDTVALIKDHKGNTTGVVWVFRDIIERKKSQELLKQQTEELERVNRLKDEFLAIVSHEIRTPLNAILGWTQLLTKRKVNEVTILQALAIIERNAKAQLIIIEDILDASQIVGGNLRLNMRPVDLRAVINFVVEDMRPQIEAKNIQVESIVEFSGAVLGDGDRLRQVIGNLLFNALKFTPDRGGVQICLRSTGNYAQIAVSDTGIGIDPDFLPHVFERFRQGDSSMTRKQGGLGLGLAIARHIVELHGGTICASSDGEGKGATFTLQLPLPNR